MFFRIFSAFAMGLMLHTADASDFAICLSDACSSAGHCCDIHQDESILYCPPDCRDSEWWLLSTEEVCNSPTASPNPHLARACFKRQVCEEEASYLGFGELGARYSRDKCVNAHRRFYDCLWGCGSRELQRVLGSFQGEQELAPLLQSLDEDGRCDGPPSGSLNNHSNNAANIMWDPDCLGRSCQAFAEQRAWAQTLLNRSQGSEPQPSNSSIFAMPAFGASSCCKEGSCSRSPACVARNTGVPILNPCLCGGNDTLSLEGDFRPGQPPIARCRCTTDDKGLVVPASENSPCGPFCPCASGLRCEPRFRIAGEPAFGGFDNDGICVVNECVPQEQGQHAVGDRCIPGIAGCGCGDKEGLTCVATGDYIAYPGALNQSLTKFECQCVGGCNDGYCSPCEARVVGPERCKECGEKACEVVGAQEEDFGATETTGIVANGMFLSNPCLCSALGLPLAPSQQKCGPCPSPLAGPCNALAASLCPCSEGLECEFDYLSGIGQCVSATSQAPTYPLLSAASRPSRTRGMDTAAAAAVAAITGTLLGFFSPSTGPAAALHAAVSVALLLASPARANVAGCDQIGANSCTDWGHCCDIHDNEIAQNCPPLCRTPAILPAYFRNMAKAHGMPSYSMEGCLSAQAHVELCIADCMLGTCSNPGPSECCGDEYEGTQYAGRRLLSTTSGENYCDRPQACFDKTIGIAIYDPCECEKKSKQNPDNFIMAGSEALPNNNGGNDSPVCNCPDGGPVGEGGSCDPFCGCGDGLYCKYPPLVPRNVVLQFPWQRKFPHEKDGTCTKNDCTSDDATSDGGYCKVGTWFTSCPCRNPQAECIIEDKDLYTSDGGQEGTCVVPTQAPSPAPTKLPTKEPTKQPSNTPTTPPTERPTPLPTKEPTKQPSNIPTTPPTEGPTEGPTPDPGGTGYFCCGVNTMGCDGCPYLACGWDRENYCTSWSQVFSPTGEDCFGDTFDNPCEGSPPCNTDCLIDPSAPPQG